MNFLILGSNGWIGKKICAQLAGCHEIWRVTRNTNLKELFRNDTLFDFVINLASSKPKAQKKDSIKSNFEFPKTILDNVFSKHWIQIESYFQLQLNMGRNDFYTIEKQKFSEFLSVHSSLNEYPKIHHLYLPHVFGKGNQNQRLITSAITAMQSGTKFEASTGSQFLPILYVDDAITGIMKFIENPTLKASCQPFWYGSVKELLELMSSRVKEFKIEYGKMPSAIDANFSRVEFPPRVQNWIPSMQLEEFIDWMREQCVN